MIAEHEDFENALAAYALGALDDKEAAELKAHLEGCASCREALGRLQSATAAVPLAVEVVLPAPNLRERILRSAAGSRLPTQAARPPRWSTLRSSRAKHRVREFPDVGPRAAVAAAVAFALGAGLGVGVGRVLAPQPPTAVGVAQYSMTGSGEMASAHGQIFELKQQRLTLVELSGLPQPDQGKVYELWLIPQSGQPVPGALFAPDSQGSHVVVLGRNLAGYKQLAVTQETAPNGSSAPTQQPELAGGVG